LQNGPLISTFPAEGDFLNKSAAIADKPLQGAFRRAPSFGLARTGDFHDRGTWQWRTNTQFDRP
jgi:hypothetical protein